MPRIVKQTGAYLRVEVPTTYPYIGRPLPFDEVLKDLREIRDKIPRIWPGAAAILVLDEDAVCSHCGYPWTEPPGMPNQCCEHETGYTQHGDIEA